MIQFCLLILYILTAYVFRFPLSLEILQRQTYIILLFITSRMATSMRNLPVVVEIW